MAVQSFYEFHLKKNVLKVNFQKLNKKYPAVTSSIYNGYEVLGSAIPKLIVGISLWLGVYKPWAWQDYIMHPEFVDRVCDGTLTTLMQP